MYEKLVKRLRERAAWINFPHHGEEFPTEDAKLMMDAADAIEELSKLADAIPHVCECCIGCEVEKKNGGCDHAFVLSPKRAMQYLSKPRWIPVTERLPEEPYGCLLIVWDSPYDGGDDFLNYLPYFAGWDGKQWNDDDGQRVPFEAAFWMPLPEPPKEETNES